MWIINPNEEDYMSKRRYYYSFAFILLAMLLSVAGCSKTTTETDAGNRLTVNLALPPDIDYDGHAVMVSLWSTWQDEIAYKTSQGVISQGEATVIVDGAATDDYMVMVAVDVADDGFADPLEAGDLFWGTVNLQINQNKTVTLTQYYWQRFRSMVFALENLPEEQNGRVCAAGVFEPGYNIMSPDLEPIAGGNTIIYNNCAVLAINPSGNRDTIPENWQLPTGEYELWSLIDVDGNPADWNNDSTPQALTDGDLIDSLGSWTYTQNVTDRWQRFTPTYTTVEAIALTLNLTFPAEYSLTGHKAYCLLLTNWGDSEPFIVDSTTISGSVATKIMSIMVAGTYQLVIIADVDGNGIENGNDPLSRGDLIWGTLDLPIEVSGIIDIPAESWQEFYTFAFAIKDIPAGHDGQPIAITVLRDTLNLARATNQMIMAGAVPIYNNSALVAMGEIMNYPDSTISTGDYNVWCLIDVDGSMDDYVTPNYWPVTANDQYFRYDFSYTYDPYEIDIINLIENPTFLPFVGISGTVTCPTWEAGHGPIYLMLFYENPLSGPNISEINRVILGAPGAYSIPCFADTSVYAVGVWDADSSGMEGDGPTQNDMVGAWGVSLDSMTIIPTGQLGAGNIDFELNVPYDTSMGGGL
jgi:hypothetical protein